MTLLQANINSTYLVNEVTGNEKIKNFLFTLGCYELTEITIISKISNTTVVNIKDGRYVIDNQIAENIILYN